jgi:hypothetical protein
MNLNIEYFFERKSGYSWKELQEIWCVSADEINCLKLLDILIRLKVSELDSLK